MVKHKYITVNSDQKKEAEFTGDLHDFACQKLNIDVAHSRDFSHE